MNIFRTIYFRLTGSKDVVEAVRRDHERRLLVRRTAARLWNDAGHRYGSAGLIHSFMVAHPETRANFERLAEIELGKSLP